MTVFRYRVFKEVNKLRSVGWALIQYDWWPNKKEEIKTPTDTEGRPRESTGRRQPFTRLGEKPQP